MIGRIIFIILFLDFNLFAAADNLPWPIVTDRLYLPFGIEWYMEGAEDKVKGYGEPVCQQDYCRWMVSKDFGTIIFTQRYHYVTLTGLELIYILKPENANLYKKKLKELKGNLDDWSITEDQLVSVISTNEHYTADSKGSRLLVKYNEGEHSVTITLDMHAK